MRPIEKIEVEYARLDSEKVENCVDALDATFTAWLATEREK